jgi:hypothetical protein
VCHFEHRSRYTNLNWRYYRNDQIVKKQTMQVLMA